MADKTEMPDKKAKANRAEEKLKAKVEKERVKSLVQLTEDNLLKEIEASLGKHATSSTFACGDTIPFELSVAATKIHDIETKSTKEDKADSIKTIEPVQIRFGESGKGITVSFPLTAQSSKELDELIAACQPASFGRGGEAVIDEDYRKAGKPDTDAFATTFCPYKAGIVDVVGQLLLPQLKHDKHLRSVRAELYKLNVYSGPSGKFKAHVDTPRSGHQFGSLVVALPVEHEGGALIVRNAGKEKVFDWSIASQADHDQLPAIKWAAFYSDCEHEVLKVTSGHRLTLTYNLFVTRGLGHLAGASALDPSQLPMYQPLKDAAIPGFLRHGRILAVWLSHSYAHTNKHNNFLPSSLKGADMSLYETVKALGLQCIIGPVITTGGYYSDEEHIMRSKFCGFNEGYSADGESFDEYGSVCWGYRIQEGKVTWINDVAKKKKKEKSSKAEENEQRTKRGEEVQLSYLAYGNEPDIDIHYSRAAMLIRIPPNRERQFPPKEPAKSIWSGIRPDYDDDEYDDEYDDYDDYSEYSDTDESMAEGTIESAEAEGVEDDEAGDGKQSKEAKMI